MKKININWKLVSIIMIALAAILLIFDTNQKSEIQMNEKVYKILTHNEWEFSKQKGYIATDLDLDDGFVHLSTAKQLSGTLYYYFKDIDSLILVQFNSSELGKELIFEDPVPKGERSGKFPHYYSNLNIKKISNFWEIKRGSFNLPKEIILEIEN